MVGNREELLNEHCFPFEVVKMILEARVAQH